MCEGGHKLCHFRPDVCPFGVALVRSIIDFFLPLLLCIIQQTTRAKAELYASLGAQNDARDLPLLLRACQETETPEGATNNPNLLETNIVRSGRHRGRDGGTKMGHRSEYANEPVNSQKDPLALALL